MTLWEALSLFPPVAIYNIFVRSCEHGKQDIVETIRGSAPYYPPNDSGQPWEKVSDDPLEYQRIVRKAKKF